MTTSPHPLDRALVDGVAMPRTSVRLALDDAGVARGDGVFETVGVWGGRPFRLGDHLERLARSLEVMALPPTDLDRLIHECESLLGGVRADAALRLFVTATGTRVVALGPAPQRPPLRTLSPQPAPWISAEGIGGAKTMSYAPNMAATRRAQAEGADDALLVSVPDGLVLEGPTFGVTFVRRGVLCVPSTDLGIVDSISRRAVLDAAVAAEVPVVEGGWPLLTLAGVTEVLVSSALRPLTAIRGIVGWTYGASPVGAALGAALARARGVAG